MSRASRVERAKLNRTNFRYTLDRAERSVMPDLQIRSRNSTMTASISEPQGPASAFPAKALPPVLFFDGECGLCNHSVRWLLDHDQRRVLRFAPLQGEMAAHYLPPLASNYQTWSVALWDKNGVHFESDASLRSIACLGGLWRLARLFLVVPRVIRHGVYRFIARNRIHWFGRIDSCVLLSAEDRARLLP